MYCFVGIRLQYVMNIRATLAIEVLKQCYVGIFRYCYSMQQLAAQLKLKVCHICNVPPNQHFSTPLTLHVSSLDRSLAK